MIQRYFIAFSLSHVYNRGNQKRERFLDEDDYLKFLALLGYYSSKYKIKIIAYCIIPNHYHLILRQSSKKSLMRFMHAVGTAYAKYFNNKYNTVGHIFQGPYRAKLIKEEKMLQSEIRYVLNNPVKHGLVDDSTLYRWVGLWEPARLEEL